MWCEVCGVWCVWRVVWWDMLHVDTGTPADRDFTLKMLSRLFVEEILDGDRVQEGSVLATQEYKKIYALIINEFSNFSLRSRYECFLFY